MTEAPTPRPGILDISAYVGGGSSVPGIEDVVKLASHENPFGPSPRARRAGIEALARPERYPPGDHQGLRRAIAVVHGLPVSQIVCGAGSDELIALLCRIYAGQGDDVIFTEHGFAMYRICALAAGAAPLAVPERARVASVDLLADRFSARTRIVFLANPNNPTGTMLGEDEIRRLADLMPPRALLVLDGAYVEYVEGHQGGASLVRERENVVMLRTFSKIHGLASLRVGWAFAPCGVADALNRVRGPFNISAPGLAAAEAAVRDVEYVAHCRGENGRLRDLLAAGVADLGLAADPSCANFVLVRFDAPGRAEAAHGFLLGRGVITRRVDEYNLPAAIRVSVGDQSGCERFLDGLSAFVKKAA